MTSALERRVEDLRAIISERHDADVRLAFVALECNSCGRRRVVDSDNMTVIEHGFRGWYVAPERPYHDLCPRCR